MTTTNMAARMLPTVLRLVRPFVENLRTDICLNGMTVARTSGTVLRFPVRYSFLRSYRSTGCGICPCSVRYLSTETAEEKMSAEQPLMRRRQKIVRMANRLSEILKQGHFLTESFVADILNNIHAKDDISVVNAEIVMRSYGWHMNTVKPALRTGMFHKTWAKFENLGIPLGVHSYNAKLYVYLANEHEFDPDQILDEMKSKGITPIQRTYEHILRFYSLRGDVAKSRDLLEVVRQKGYNMTVYMFVCLMHGLFKANDEESALKCYEHLISLYPKPDKYIYNALAVGYSYIGKIDKVIEIKDQAANHGMFLDDKISFHVVPQLVRNNNLAGAIELMKNLKVTARYLFVLNELIQYGHLDAFCDLVQYGGLKNIYVSVQCAVACSEDTVAGANEIIRFVEKLQKLDVVGSLFTSLARAAATFKKRHLLMDVMERIYEEETERNIDPLENGIYKVMVSLSKVGDVESLAEMKRRGFVEKFKMEELYNSVSFTCYLDNLKSFEDKVHFISKTVEVTPSVLMKKFSKVYLYHNKLIDTALQFASEKTGDEQQKLKRILIRFIETENEAQVLKKAREMFPKKNSEKKMRN